VVKRSIVILIIFLGLIAACIAEYFYVNKTFDYLEDKLEEFIPMLSKNEDQIDTDINVSYLTELQQDWNKKSKTLKSLIWHSGIKEIEIGLSRIKTYTEENNFTEASTELNALIEYVDYYSDDFALSLENMLYYNKSFVFTSVFAN